MGSNFVFNWPSSSFGLSRLDHMVDSIKMSDVERKDDVIDKLKKTSTALHAASNLWTDGIILPHQTREVRMTLLSV